MKSITAAKPFDDVLAILNGLDRVFVVGCGTCTTMTRTGGIDQVNEMRGRLQEAGKRVTGARVIPTACDDMTGPFLKESGQAIGAADAIVSLSCALGVHRLALTGGRPVIPAVDTVFIGVEETPGVFKEVCAQCGQCLLGETAGVCPVTACHKGLVNGPCGGTNNGKCEVDKEKDCAWTLIYNRLKDQGRLDLMGVYRPPRNHHVVPRPRSSRFS